MRAIILAAGVGRRLAPETESAPKCLLDIGGKSLLLRALEALDSTGIRQAIVVVGHLKEQVVNELARGPAGVEVRLVQNPQFTKGSILSLWRARYEFDDDLLVMHGDLLFPQELLARLLASPEVNAIAVDERFPKTGDGQQVVCEDGWVVEVTRKGSRDPRMRGEAVGFLRLTFEAAEVLRGILEEFIETGKDSLEYEDAIRELATEIPIGVVEVGDLPWIGIDVAEDLARARASILTHVDALDRGQVIPSA